MSYPIGTICIGQNFVKRTEFNGAFCEVIIGCHLRQIVGTGEINPSYIVRFECGEELSVLPHQLRLKRHDEEDKEARLRAKDLEKVKALFTTPSDRIKAGVPA